MPQRNPHSSGIDDYKSELVAHLSEAWQGARENIKGAQVKQKRQYDRRTRKADVKPGDRVMVYLRCSHPIPRCLIGAITVVDLFHPAAVVCAGAKVGQVEMPPKSAKVVAKKTVAVVPYRTYWWCPVAGCRAKPQKKLSNHLKVQHPELSKRSSTRRP